MKIMCIGQGKNFNWMKDVYKHNRGHAIPKNQIMDEDGKSGPRPTTDYQEEMPDIDTLESEAAIAAELRGHTLGNWKRFNNGSHNYSSNSCLVCNKQVQVCDRPQANEIDMGGEAVALSCTD